MCCSTLGCNCHTACVDSGGEMIERVIRLKVEYPQTTGRCSVISFLSWSAAGSRPKLDLVHF